jgi:hypothetical protein
VTRWGVLAVATQPPRDGGDPAVRRPEGTLEQDGKGEPLLATCPCEGVTHHDGKGRPWSRCGLGETEPLERRFDAAIIGVYLEAASLGYRSCRSLERVRECGGVAIAREILAAERVHDGLAALFLLGRLDPTAKTPA